MEIVIGIERENILTSGGKDVRYVGLSMVRACQQYQFVANGVWVSYVSV